GLAEGALGAVEVALPPDRPGEEVQRATDRPVGSRLGEVPDRAVEISFGLLQLPAKKVELSAVAIGASECCPGPALLRELDRLVGVNLGPVDLEPAHVHAG